MPASTRKTTSSNISHRIDNEGSIPQIKTELQDTKSDYSNAQIDEDEEDACGSDSSDADEYQDRLDAIADSIDYVIKPDEDAQPDLPAYRPNFRLVEEQCTALAAKAANLLETSEYKDGYTSRLLLSIKEAVNIKYPQGKKIALMGDSGVGKSSLINALLNSPDLSAQGASGGACTCVTTEFVQAEEAQTLPFNAEVYFYASREIRAMVEEHLRHYIQFRGGDFKDSDDDDWKARESLGSTAWEVFQAVFASYDVFQKEETARGFLASATAAADDEVLHRLVTWASDMISQENADSGVISFSATTAVELRTKLRRFVEKNTNFEDEKIRCCSYWPFVRLVRVGLKSQLLGRGLIIADLPGLSDTNRTRKRTTEQYLQQCAFVLVVAPIKRVLTDDQVHARILKVLRKPGKAKLLVCTMIDDMPHGTSARDVALTSQDEQDHEKLSRYYKVKKEEHRALAEALKGKNKKLAKSKKLAKRELADKGERLKICRALMTHSLIEKRNTKVKRVIYEKYKAISGSATKLGVHFVSNKHYEMYLEGCDDEIPLPLGLTGIPELRYRLSSVPAEEKLSVLNHYRTLTIRSKLDSMKMFAQQSSIERRVELKKIVRKPSTLLASEIVTHVKDLEAVLAFYFLQPLDKAKPRWKECGIRVAAEWTQMNHATFAAWCRNDGRHKTANHPFRDWNEDLLKPVKLTVDEEFPKLNGEIEHCKERFLATLLGLLAGIEQDLKAEKGVASYPMQPFLQSLSTKRKLLEKLLEHLFTDLDSLKRKIFELSSSSDEDSILKETMLPFYEKLVNTQGAAIFVQRKTLLKDFMDRGAPVEQFQPKLQELFNASLATQRTQLEANLQKFFNTIVEDYDTMFIVKELPDEKRDSLKKQIQEFVDHAEAQCNGPIETEYAKLVSKG